MWQVKQQSKSHPNGIIVSPPMETQDGARTMLELLAKEAAKAPDAAENPRHYFVTAYIPRRKK